MTDSRARDPKGPFCYTSRLDCSNHHYQYTPEEKKSRKLEQARVSKSRRIARERASQAILPLATNFTSSATVPTMHQDQASTEHEDAEIAEQGDMRSPPRSPSQQSDSGHPERSWHNLRSTSALAAKPTGAPPDGAWEGERQLTDDAQFREQFHDDDDIDLEELQQQWKEGDSARPGRKREVLRELFPDIPISTTPGSTRPSSPHELEGPSNAELPRVQNIEDTAEPSTESSDARSSRGKGKQPAYGSNFGRRG